MRRARQRRPPQPRQPFGFESLEPRSMLFADAGIEWWPSWDAAVVDDWSWTFDDSWAADASGDASWTDASWNDGWWVGDVGVDDSAATGFDVDWSGGADDAAVDGADGIIDVPVTSDVVSFPVNDDAASTTDDSSPFVLDTEIESLPAPLPLPNTQPVEVTVPPDASDVDLSIAIGEAVDLIELPAIEIPSDTLPAIDASTDGESTNEGDGWHAAAESWTLDTTPIADIRVDVSTVDVTTPDDGGGGEPVALPIPMVVAPVVTDRVAPAVVPPSAGPSVTPTASRGFGAWSAFFFQGFGGQTDAADGAATAGQPGSGRPRIRLPFWPVA